LGRLQAFDPEEISTSLNPRGPDMKILALSVVTGVLFASAAYAVENGPFNVAMLRDKDVDTMQLAQANASPSRRTPEYRRPALREGKTQALFVRSGYTLAASGQGLADAKNAMLYSAGYRARISQKLPLSFEGEVVFQRDSDPVIIGVGQEQATRRAVSGLVSLRYDGPKFGPVTPYFSGSVGPVHVRNEIDDGFTPLSDSNIELAYGARVGFALPVTRTWSVEAGYRLLGATNDDIKTHTAELGLSYRF
jgi:opacity protein-like surface antigen